MTLLRIVTRKSPLALWQAEYVRKRLSAIHPDLGIELIGVQTTGDQILDAPLARIGGKGLFIKELEQCLVDGTADIAVHSVKDVTVDLPPGLDLPVILEREDPRDVLVSEHYESLEVLPLEAVVGTSSLRRQCQLRAYRPDLTIRDLRGNVGTRIKKLKQGEFNAIILAAAGLKRLGIEAPVKAYLDPELMLPAIGQGAIGIECRAGDKRVIDLIRPLNHRITEMCIRAERAFNQRLCGGCQVPVAAYAELRDQNLYMRALIGRADGTKILREAVHGPCEEAEQLGRRLAEDLLLKGGEEILKQLLGEPQARQSI